MGNTMFGLGFQFPVLQEICSNQTKGILQNGEFPKFESMSFNVLLELSRLIGSFSFLNNPQNIPRFVAFKTLTILQTGEFSYNHAIWGTQCSTQDFSSPFCRKYVLTKFMKSCKTGNSRNWNLWYLDNLQNISHFVAFGNINNPSN